MKMNLLTDINIDYHWKDNYVWWNLICSLKCGLVYYRCEQPLILDCFLSSSTSKQVDNTYTGLQRWYWMYNSQEKLEVTCWPSFHPEPTWKSIRVLSRWHAMLLLYYYVLSIHVIHRWVWRLSLEVNSVFRKLIFFAIW